MTRSCFSLASNVQKLAVSLQPSSLKISLFCFKKAFCHLYWKKNYINFLSHNFTTKIKSLCRNKQAGLWAAHKKSRFPPRLSTFFCRIRVFFLNKVLSWWWCDADAPRDEELSCLWNLKFFIFCLMMLLMSDFLKKTQTLQLCFPTFTALWHITSRRVFEGHHLYRPLF